ncbi:Major facilitator superfamily,Major facilitator superfamily domain [Cinara cedri]|uniref:Major facilitator superfamily,Major facilitator superfamily domain n=1 Tax=Cinara cedri TaxID=506608 RepID=A0A5E4NA30_9HEMI|nr:Major facilitator superfamily,Major facilitator superfamily domain [Cinara cedri]
MTDNSSANERFVELSWNESEKSTVLSSFYWGYLITQVYAGQMAHIYGGKYFLAGAVGISGVLTIITPWSAIHGDVPVMCANRMSQGMAQGFIYPAINVLLSKWVPKSEKSRLISFVFSGQIFGALTMFPMAGHLAGSAGGWPAIFYVGGVLALVWALIWSLIGANSPREHESISEAEREFIISSLNNTTSKKPLKIPWEMIIKSTPLWTLIIVHMAQNWGFWILQTNIPIYMNYVLNFNVEPTGFLTIMPYLVAWISIIIFSWISDYINSHSFMSNTNQRKMWNSIAHWSGALVLISLCFNTSATGAMILLTIALSLNGGIITGFMANHMDLAPNFAGILMGITNSLANITTILGPLIVGLIIRDNNNSDQWAVVFLISAGIFFTGNLIYILFGSAEIQSWNDSQKTNETQTRNNDENP